MDFGAFVELEPGSRGPDPHLRAFAEPGPPGERLVQAGQEVEVRILKIEPEAKKISLSLRPLPNAVPEPRGRGRRGRHPPPRPSRSGRSR